TIVLVEREIFCSLFHLSFFFFFFSSRRRHTRFSRDWSSDVCSSDLVGTKALLQIKAPFAGKALVTVEREKVYDYWIVDLAENTEIGRASCRERVLILVDVAVE